MTVPRMTKKDKSESWPNFWKPLPFSPNIKYPSHSFEYEITKHIKTTQPHTLGVFSSFKKACTLVLEKCICLSINPLSLFLAYLWLPSSESQGPSLGGQFRGFTRTWGMTILLLLLLLLQRGACSLVFPCLQGTHILGYSSLWGQAEAKRFSGIAPFPGLPSFNICFSPILTTLILLLGAFTL